MNEYKITYSGESEGYRIITDRTEAAAKKFFREDAKELSLGRITIESVELLSTNALASKRNEHETLEVIRQLVADLGEQSYLATAFEGCFEDAEVNIENDFGDSWKRRCESAERKLDEAQAEIENLREKLAESEKDYEAAHAANHELADQKDAEIKALQNLVLSPSDLDTVHKVLQDLAEDADREAERAAAEIVRFAEAPALPEFKKAVAANRNATAYAKSIRELLGRVVAVEAAAHVNSVEAA